MEVDVAITLEDQVFDEELENKSSARYQKMEKEVEKEVKMHFKGSGNLATSTLHSITSLISLRQIKATSVFVPSAFDFYGVLFNA